MRHTYEIYQLKSSNPKAFMPLDFVNNRLGGVNFEEYKHVYSSEIEGDDTIVMLETLFEIFNLRHPEDFLGHSLSMSDIVILDDKKYYCDSFGWKAID